MGASAAGDAADAQTAAASEANALQKYIYEENRKDQEPWRTAGGNAVKYISQILGIPGSTVSGSSGGSASSIEKPNIENYRTTKTSGGDGIPPFYVGPESRNPSRPYTGPELSGSQSDYDYARYNKDLQAYTDSLSSQATSSTPLDLTNILRATPGYKFTLDEGIKSIQRSAAAKGNLLSPGTMKELTTYGEGVADQTYGNYLKSLMSVAGLGQSSANTTTAAGTSYANAASNNLLSAGNATAAGYINQANAFTGATNSLSNNFLLWNMMNNKS